MGGTGFRGVGETFPGRRTPPLNAGPEEHDRDAASFAAEDAYLYTAPRLRRANLGGIDQNVCQQTGILSGAGIHERCLGEEKRGRM